MLANSVSNLSTMYSKYLFIRYYYFVSILLKGANNFSDKSYSDSYSYHYERSIVEITCKSCFSFVPNKSIIFSKLTVLADANVCVGASELPVSIAECTGL